MSSQINVESVQVRVYYVKAYPMTEEYFKWHVEVTRGKQPTKLEFNKNYALMHTEEYHFAAPDLEICEQAFVRFNDYIANPLSSGHGGDGQRIVKDSLTAHTSMSIGDIVVVGTKAYFCADCGFELLPFEVA